MRLKKYAFFAALAVAAALAALSKNILDEQKTLRAVIERLTADSRVAEAVVTDSRDDPAGGAARTTIKFVEYDSASRPLPPKYFTFSGNIIQFQSLVIRFDDFLVKKGHPLKGKSAYVFLKAFSLSPKMESYDINKAGDVPGGYAVPGAGRFQKRLWERFWRYALDETQARRQNIKNAQIEAPGTKFVPGMLYTLKIEHDGGLRIDSRAMAVLENEERVDPR